LSHGSVDEPRRTTKWGWTLVAVTFVVAGIVCSVTIFGIELLVASLVGKHVTWGEAPLIWKLVHLGVPAVSAVMCTSAVMRRLANQWQQPARAAALGTIVGFCVVLGQQVYVEVSALTGHKPDSVASDTDSPAVTIVHIVVVILCIWLGRILWSRMEIRRALPGDLQDALVRAELLQNALWHHRRAVRHSSELVVLEERSRSLADSVTTTTGAAVEALNQATREAEATIAAARQAVATKNTWGDWVWAPVPHV